MKFFKREFPMSGFPSSQVRRASIHDALPFTPWFLLICFTQSPVMRQRACPSSDILVWLSTECSRERDDRSCMTEQYDTCRLWI
jgi:hypothetical protein